jgi:hypothetical protein
MDLSVSRTALRDGRQPAAIALSALNEENELQLQRGRSSQLIYAQGRLTYGVVSPCV